MLRCFSQAVFAFLWLICLVGCGQPAPVATPPVPTPVMILPTARPQAVFSTATPSSAPARIFVIASATARPTRAPASATLPPPPAVITAAAATVPAEMFPAILFLIALGDKGKSGTAVACDDSLVPVMVSVPKGARPAETLRNLLTQLLQDGDQYSGGAGLYNALNNASLKIETVAVQEGLTKIVLTGDLTAGNDCDAARMLAQLENTVRAFEPVNGVRITVNGVALKEALGIKP